MGKKTAFIGHRDIYCNDIEKRLTIAIENEIDLGCKYFTMGTHGEFDKLSLSVCKKLRHQNKDLEIEVVITSLNQIKPTIEIDEKYGKIIYDPFDDVKTIMYDIENEYFKKRITANNKQMIDNCDTLICYVDPNSKHSGAKNILNYAKKKGLKIINLFQKEDDFLADLSSQEKAELYKQFFKS